jgi:hypothetical protein
LLSLISLQTLKGHKSPQEAKSSPLDFTPGARHISVGTPPTYAPMPSPFQIQPFSSDDAPDDDGAATFYPRPEITGEDEDENFSLEELQEVGGELPPELTDMDALPDAKLAEILTESHVERLANSNELRRLIEGAMEGTLQTDKPLVLPHTQKLNARAIQVIMLRISGYNGLEIASLTGYHPVYVRIILTHPYAKRILVVAMANGIAHSTVVTRKLQRRVPKMLKIVEQIAENKAVDPPVRLRAAFGWLDRAGVGPTEKREISQKSENSVTITHKRSNLIATAIREARNALDEPETVKEADFSIVESPEEGSEETSEVVQGDLFDAN